MFKLIFFAEVEYKDQVKSELFSLGLGKIGVYDFCCYEIKGVGQFRSLEGANLYKGNIGEMESFEEYKIEMVCPDHLIEEVVVKLKEVHFYEMSVYDVIKFYDF